MASDGESVAQTTGPLRRGSVDSAGVRAIMTAVGRLLIDYAVQLRDNLQTGDVSFKEEGWGDEASNMAKVENTDSSSAAGSGTFAAHARIAARGPADTENETAPLTEADTAESRQLLERLQRVKHLLVQFSGVANCTQGPHGAIGASYFASEALPAAKDVGRDVYRVSCETVRQNPVLMLALRRFDGVTQRFQGTATPMGGVELHTGGHVAAEAVDSMSETRALPDIRPFLNPVSLADGTLSAFSRNVGIVFRRRSSAAGTAATGKRLRDEAHESVASSFAFTAVAPNQPNYWHALAAQQRKRRFAIYSARSALLPRVNAVCAPLYVSPAVQELARLNSEAERVMLKRAWCVHTKAHLLRELPWVARDVSAYRAALREVLQSFTEAQQADFLADVVYTEFVCAESGVVRVCLQHALFLDLSYDVRRRQWTLIALHWNLFTTSAGASLMTAQAAALAVPYVHSATVPPPAPATSALGPLVTQCSPQGTRDPASPPVDASAPASLVRIVPHDREALHNFLQRAFAQDGLSGGLQAANRLLCAVVMDTFATQLQALQECFFTGGGLGRHIDADVRPGTLISFHLSLPRLFVSLAPTAHVKMTVTGGTVVLECVRGTDLSTRRVTLPLSTSSLATLAATCENTATRKLSVTVVDMEALLWQCVCAPASP
ncbi:hypothetical protein JKF63_02615 [Porcisia hertigi]|uniref:Uncharacterized protein n=1 Tax=Porcisia hertigi TaxID=2761500 RepID=A0A836LDQ3_9TRYP|nr:hypothetical protein JKF63_02615 [Porcisia hertigi]